MVREKKKQPVKSEGSREPLKNPAVCIVIYTFLAHRKQWWSCKKKIYSYLPKCHAYKPEASLRELMGNNLAMKD